MGKVVLVTGGNTGIGAAIVKAFSEKGYSVIIHYYELQSEAEKLVCSSKGKCVMVELLMRFLGWLRNWAGLTSS